MNLKKPIYLDYAATTPVDKRVIAKMNDYLSIEGHFGNTASNHAYGVSAHDAVVQARENIAHLLNTTARNIIFTSGATESNNLAIKGVADFYQGRGKHIITSQSEHRSVLDSLAYLETKGFLVTYLQPNEDGLITLDQLEAAIQKDTILVSIMHVNNETGVIQDIAKIGKLTRRLGILFHVDAVQSVGKLSINLQEIQVDLLSLSAHKLYGPKGIGALYINDNPRVKLTPLLHGGNQERKFRSGTLPTHQIVGMGEAFQIAGSEMTKEVAHLKNLQDLLWEGIKDLSSIVLNGHPIQRVPNILNIQFKNLKKEEMVKAFEGVAISNASACNSITLEPSHVLKSMGLNDIDASQSFRISMGRFTTEAEIQVIINLIRRLYL